MKQANFKICGQCGERATVGRIYFFRVLSEKDRAKLGTTSAELDMLLCEPCVANAFKHLKRMFSLRDFELSDKTKGDVPA